MRTKLEEFFENDVEPTLDEDMAIEMMKDVIDAHTVDTGSGKLDGVEIYTFCLCTDDDQSYFGFGRTLELAKRRAYLTLISEFFDKYTVPAGDVDAASVLKDLEELN